MFDSMKMIYIRRILLHVCMIGGTVVQLFLLSSSSSNTVLQNGADSSMLVPRAERYFTDTGLVRIRNVPPHRTMTMAAEESQTAATTTPANTTIEEEEDQPVFMARGFPNAPMCSDPIIPTNVTVTLVTQTSMDRLWMMEHHCRRWGLHHPISIAIATNLSTKVLSTVLHQLGCARDMTTIQSYGDFHSPTSYPVNQLRNLALSAVRTSHALVLDMDFLLEQNAFEILHQFQTTLSIDHQTSLVVPAFEFRSLCSTNCQKLHEALLPQTKSELLDLYMHLEVSKDATVAPFDSKKNTVGHGSTRYADWTTQRDDELLPIECVTSPRYEPYVVVRYCNELPPFQEAFHGYGQNKMTWMQQLIRSGYRFYQTPTFCIHFPHKPSDARKQWDKQRHAILVQSQSSSANSTNDTATAATAVVVGGDVAEKDPAVLYASLKVNQISSKFQAWMREHVPDRSVLSKC